MSSLGATLGSPARAATRARTWTLRRITVVRQTAEPRAQRFVDAVGRVSAPARRVLGPILQTLSPFGWAVVLLSVLAWIVGLAFGWAEFSIVALMGASLVALCFFFVLGRSAYAVKLNLALNRVVVGQRAFGQIEVRNASTRALLPARIELPVGAAVATFPLPRLGADDVHEDLFIIPTARRSVIAVGPLRSVRGDALGLFRREVNWTGLENLYVHPRTVNLDGSSSGFLKDLEGLPTKDLSNSDVSFHALRDYVAGDDRRYVHWKSTARTGVLMVRQFEETRRSHVAIATSLAVSDYTDPEEFELAVSGCGSIGLQVLKEEKELSVLVQGSRLHSETGKRLLDELSGVAQRDSREDIVELARTLGRTVPQASVAILLFGGSVTPSQLRTAASHIPLGVRVIALNCVPGQEVTRRTIGDLVLLTVGSLDELPRAMRRVTA